jgi:hypothetical protein
MVTLLYRFEHDCFGPYCFIPLLAKRDVRTFVGLVFLYAVINEALRVNVKGMMIGGEPYVEFLR